MTNGTLYCTAQDVADYLNIGKTLDSNSDPTTAQVEQYIVWAMEELERRTNRAWRTKQYVKEIKDINPAWQFTRGTPLYLTHTDVKTFDHAEGDRLEIWNGNSYDDITNQEGTSVLSERLGKLWLRGYLWTAYKTDRIRVTYRYGSDLTPDVTEMTIKLTAMKWLGRSFNLKNISFGGSVSPYTVMDRWKEEIDNWVMDVMEWVVIEG